MAWRKGQAYGQDLRDRVLAAEGTLSAIAERFGVSPTYVARARARQRQLGEDTPGAQCNHVPPKLAGLEPALMARVESQPDQTLAQLCQWMQAEHGIQVSVKTMWTTLDRLGLSYKKNVAGSRANTR